MINELHLRKRGTPDEIFTSYYTDVLEIAKKKSIRFNIKEKPLLPNTYYFDEGDKIIFCIVGDEEQIFHKPLQIATGTYFENNLDDWLKVDEILFQENYEMRATIQIPAGKRKVVSGDEIPLGKMGVVLKGVINNNALHLLWNEKVNSKIRNWFFREEQNKQAKEQAKVELDFDVDKDTKDDDDDLIDFLNPDTEPEEKITLVNSSETFNKWFHKKFPKRPILNVSPLMENYVLAINNFHKYHK